MVRRTYCPDGRRIYRWSDKTGDLAEGRVATRAELARQRRRPAPGQEPVGSLWAVRRYVPLYRVAHTVELPPLPPKRLAAWVAMRTCVRCGLQRNQPWPGRDSDGLRICWGCQQAEKDNAFLARRNVDRARAETHALALLSDPDTVVIDVDRVGDAVPRVVRVSCVDTAGTVLVDFTYAEGDQQPTAEEFVEALQVLSGRRLVMWRVNWLSTLKSALLSSIGGEEVAPGVRRLQEGHPAVVLAQSLTVAPWHACPYEIGGGLGHLVDLWRPVDQPVRYAARDDHQAYSALFGIPVEPPAAMHLAVLRAVAAGRHPAGPARCPYRPDRVPPPCDRTDLTVAGMCPAHSPAPEGTPS